MSSLPVLDGGVAPEAPRVVLPRAGVVFRARAERLHVLAAGHAAGAWLEALAWLCEAQDSAVGRDAGWDAALQRIVDAMHGAPLPAAAREALAVVGEAAAERRAAWAAAIAGDAEDASAEPPAAVALFVAAALQVEHTARAARLVASEVPRADADCPVCRAPAAAGVVTGDTKTRYLACSRCASAWHRVRVSCATCGSTSALEYVVLERLAGGAAPGVKAEACGRCRTYVKLFYEEDRPGVEPLADDAATLALDVLMGEAGWARGGVNPLVRAGRGTR